jgi:GntR family transcriptional regulator
VDLTVDPADPVPPYEQVRRQLHDLITAGALAEDDRLPPVRQLAGDLGLAPGTVARAYKELEQAGLLATRRGAGTRVRRPAGGVPRERLLREHTAAFVARARDLGFSDREIRRAVDDAV